MKRDQKKINAKISATLKGRRCGPTVVSDETRKKLSKAGKKGSLHRVYETKHYSEQKHWNSGVRRKVIEDKGSSCEKCGWSAKHPKTGSPLVQVHHIDEDKSNNDPENLIILCPNCHSMTDGYMFYGKNHK